MTTLYILAHHDDEYLALPLMLRTAERGEAQSFVFLTDSGKNARWRQRESRALLRAFDLDDSPLHFVGDERRVPDGRLSERLDAAWEGLCAAADAVTDLDRIVVCAWEGGHPDHDSCALLASMLSERTGAPVWQFSLYHGKGRIGPIFNACAPLEENGPTEGVRMDARRWRKFARSVWRYPSQFDVFLSLWPSMFLAFVRSGFRYQTLQPGRVFERPHEGKLLYERTRKLSYAEFRARADAFVARIRPDLARAAVPAAVAGEALTHAPEPRLPELELPGVGAGESVEAA